MKRGGDILPRSERESGSAASKVVLDPVGPPSVDCSRAVVVVTVHNAAHVVRPCLRAFHLRTQLGVALVVVDDASDAYTARMLDEECERMRGGGRVVDLVRNPKNLRYTKSINLGLRRAYREHNAEWAVALNSDVLVTPGWLEWMLAAGQVPGAREFVQAGRRCDKGVGLVSPLSDNAALLTLDMAPGSNYLDTAARLAVLARGTVAPAVTVVGFCMAIKRECWDDAGPFDEEMSPVGYGEECDFQGRAWQAGWWGAVALSAYCHHESHASFGPSAAKLEREGTEKFLSRWANNPDPSHRWFGPASHEARARDLKPQLTTAMRTTRVATGRPAVAFYLHGVQMCGGVLALANICNGLVERGWDATIAVTHDRWNEWKLFRPTFAIARLDKPEQWEDAGAPTRGVVLATSWSTGAFVERVAKLYPELRAGAFVQDREDWFRTPDGSLQHSRDDLSPYLRLCSRHSIVNSMWVLASMAKDHKVPASAMEFVPIGTNPDLFYPREEPIFQGRVRVLSFCRHSTPRRGYDLLEALYKRLSRRLPALELATYDEQPRPGLATLHLGKLPQEELAKHMRTFDVLIEPSSVQGWGMAAHEAMASGLAVVSLENGGIRNYADERSCRIVKTPEGATVEDMAELIEAEILRLVSNRAAAAALGATAREVGAAISWGAVAEAWDVKLRRWLLDP